MKKAILCLLLFTATVVSFGQSTTSGPAQSAEKYLQNSRLQKVGGVLLVCTSLGLFVKGFAYSIDVGGGDGFFVASAACFTGGVVLFVVGASNTRKAKKLLVATSLKMEGAPLAVPIGITAQPYPALTLRISL